MVDEPAERLFEAVPSGSDLMVRLDTELPPALPVGRGTALFCSGACFHRHEPVTALSVLVDGVAHRPAAWAMPRLDLFQMSHPTLDLGADEPPAFDPDSSDDPDLRCYRSGFWATLPIGPRNDPGTVEVALAVRLASGTSLVAPIGRIDVVAPAGSPELEAATGSADGSIAICMATFDPEPDLLAAQIESLKAQTDTDWICVISDDCSPPARFERIVDLVAGDPRFHASRSPVRLGAYRNFERALELVPPETRLVALCDQDDRWYPHKLEVLRARLGTAQLVYSDQRLVDAGGRVLAQSFWRGRRNNHTNLASLLVANSVTGAAALMRREVADLSRPFPEPPGWLFHDHWIALVAMATGGVAYVDEPLYDYVQHRGAMLGRTGRRRPGPRSLREWVRCWRPAYFYGYLAREVLAQALLARFGTTLTASKRRSLERFVAAPRSPLAFAWLALRPLRSVVGANETLGTETELALGIAWRRLVELRVGSRSVPFGAPFDATCPPLDASTLGQRRLARWRARG